MAPSHDLDRFLTAQKTGGAYAAALKELKEGRKRSHWIWFVLPQVRGLGRSPTAQHFGIASRAEAEAYLAHPVLGARLRECAAILLELPAARTAEDILGPLDALKLRSSMTLFDRVATAEARNPFAAVLERYFAGEADPATEALIAPDGPAA